MDADRLMPKLLAILVRNKTATACRLVAGHPPQLLISDHEVRLEISSLSRQNTVDLIRSVTPRDNQAELDNVERTIFDFTLSENEWIELSLSGTAGDYVVQTKPSSDVSTQNN